jgi:hypothetical protein
MPYDNAYNRKIANELSQINHRFATLYAYSPVDGSSSLSGGAGVLFQMGNASKRDGEDNMYNDELKLPPQYYYGNNAESMMGGSGFAEGTFRDTGFGHQDGAEDMFGGSSSVGEYEKGMGMSGGNKEISGMTNDLFGKASPDQFRMLGRMLGQHMKGKGMSGGSILSDLQEGLSDTLGFVPRLFMGGASPADKEVGVGGAILGNPDPYPVMGNSDRIAGRGKMTAKERKALESILAKHPEMTGAGFWDDFKKGFNSVISPVASVVKAVAPFLGQPEISAGLSAIGYGKEKKTRGRPKGSKKAELKSANGDLLAMSSPVLSNGVPPTAQLRGSYGGAKHSDSLKESVIKAVEKKMKGKGKEGGANLKGMTDKTKEMSGAGDARKKRAEIVKRIMKEKGLSMINASKYVKEHNLYKK